MASSSTEISPLSLIRQCYRFLLDHMCFESGLLTHLHDGGVISDALMERLHRLPAMAAREHLLLFIARQSRDAYDSYVQALVDSNQQHVASKLVNTGASKLVNTEEKMKSGEVGGSQNTISVTEEEEKSMELKVERHREDIINTVKPFDVCPSLFEFGLLSIDDYDDLLRVSTEPAMQCGHLLDILRTVDPLSAPYSQFVRALQKRYSELVDVIHGRPSGVPEDN